MDTIILSTNNGVDIIRLDGKATMKNVSEITKILDEAKNVPIFDFTKVTYLDSTFLGLIAKYTMLYKTKYNKYLTIINPCELVLNLLKQTGILKFLIILNENTTSVNGKVIESKMATPEQILELHEILSDLNEENKKEFEKVVEQMRKVVGKKDE
ncbi:STAS domain-containing protein [Oceanivirga miroungae]|uniref:STAS domain-containing protein n=1 Tax=Oceanivirga miroungae TaxID=1130046 RepID=A0A6I8MEV1_9FUSO|nr:STAS domain-containing protein [Oceanivirga miroungae]VWL85769.1 hypothetical protein OMES3154_01057 [Oceanivirga miroungae]